MAVKPKPETVDVLLARIASFRQAYVDLLAQRTRLTELVLAVDVQLKQDREALARLVAPALEDPGADRRLAPKTNGRRLTRLRSDEARQMLAYVRSLDGRRVDFRHAAEKIVGDTDRQAQKRIYYALDQLRRRGVVRRINRGCYVVREQ